MWKEISDGRESLATEQFAERKTIHWLNNDTKDTSTNHKCCLEFKDQVLAPATDVFQLQPGEAGRLQRSFPLNPRHDFVLFVQQHVVIIKRHDRHVYFQCQAPLLTEGVCAFCGLRSL